jgi:hypothetical protein
MGAVAGVVDRYVAYLARSAPEAAGALSKALSIPRRAASEVFAGAAALVLAGVARYARHRESPSAAWGVVEKYGRPADLGAPEIAIGAHLARPDLSPRLGGLLGDAADPFCSWLATRTSVDPAVLGRGIAASAPLALGALASTVHSQEIDDLLSSVPEATLADPACLLEPTGVCAQAFRRLRRAGLPWLSRVLTPA